MSSMRADVNVALCGGERPRGTGDQGRAARTYCSEKLHNAKIL